MKTCCFGKELFIVRAEVIHKRCLVSYFAPGVRKLLLVLVHFFDMFAYVCVAKVFLRDLLILQIIIASASCKVI